MEHFRYCGILVAFVSLAGCVTHSNMGSDGQQTASAVKATTVASPTASNSSDSISTLEALNVTGDWRFAECCRIRLPSGARVFSGPSTIDGPSTYVVRRNGEAVSMKISSGPLAVPPGGQIQQSDTGITFRHYIRDDGETAIFAADRTPPSSPLDKKTVTFAANDQASVELLRDLTRTMIFIAPYETDREGHHRPDPSDLYGINTPGDFPLALQVTVRIIDEIISLAPLAFAATKMEGG